MTSLNFLWTSLLLHNCTFYYNARNHITMCMVMEDTGSGFVVHVLLFTLPEYWLGTSRGWINSVTCLISVHAITTKERINWIVIILPCTVWVQERWAAGAGIGDSNEKSSWRGWIMSTTSWSDRMISIYLLSTFVLKGGFFPLYCAFELLPIHSVQSFENTAGDGVKV